MIIGVSYSQDNSNNSSGIPFSSSNSKSKNSLLNLKKKENPFLKKLEKKNKKNFFPDAKVEKKRPERFINSNGFYLSRLNKKESESNKNVNQFKVDMFLGEIRNDGEYVNIVLRDHEYPDGDLIKVQVNDEVVMPAILLTEKAKGFKLDLKSSFNVVDFATAVDAIDVYKEGQDTVMSIEPNGFHEYLAYQTDKTLTIDVKAITEEE